MYFTVVIPLYNKKRHIGRAIKSVISQTYQNFEIVIVDDGSTDNGVNEIIKIEDPRIILIRQENKGVSSARNRGIDAAKYNYIAFLDADDIWKPNFLESIKKLIEEYPKAGAYATSYGINNENGILVPSLNFYSFEEKWYGIVDDYFKYAIKAPLITASSVVIPKAVFNEIGKFPVGIKRGEDLDMWRRIALKYDIVYLNEICAIYFHDADNRACKRKSMLIDLMVNYSEEILFENKGLENYSPYFVEYMINNIITKARYLIDEGKAKEARKLLNKYKYTKLNKKYLTKMYILSWIPNPIKELIYRLKDRSRKDYFSLWKS